MIGTRPGVLMVTGAYYPELSGGGLQCKAIVDTLKSELTFRVLTTCTDPSLAASRPGRRGPRSEEEEVDGTPVRRVFIDVTSALSKLRAAAAFTAAMIRWRRDVDVVHLHGFSEKSILVVALAKVLGKRIVLTIHTAEHDEPAAIRKMGAMAAWAYGAVDLYIAVSAGTADRAVAQGLERSRVWIGSNGLDVRRFRPASPVERASARNALALPPNGKLILFVGFFSRDKGPQVLFDAWTRIAGGAGSGSSLVFVGATASKYFEVDPALAPEIRSAAARGGLSDRVIFVEETRAIEEYYRAADVFVFPSRREAFGMVLVEAMASALPCIASRLPGVTDAIVSDGVTGLLVAPHDAPAVAGALVRVLSDDRLAGRLGAAARESVASRYAIDVTARRMVDAYRHVLGADVMAPTAA